jgi:hypothetical protein
MAGYNGIEKAHNGKSLNIFAAKHQNVSKPGWIIAAHYCN